MPPVDVDEVQERFDPAFAWVESSKKPDAKPNWEALEKWMNKVLKEMTELASEVDRAREAAEDAKSDKQDALDEVTHLSSVVDLLYDVQRGVASMSEVGEWLRVHPQHRESD